MLEWHKKWIEEIKGRLGCEVVGEVDMLTSVYKVYIHWKSGDWYFLDDGTGCIRLPFNADCRENSKEFKDKVVSYVEAFKRENLKVLT